MRKIPFNLLKIKSYFFTKIVHYLLKLTNLLFYSELLYIFNKLNCIRSNIPYKALHLHARARGNDLLYKLTH